jgi:Domain of unknown function (DUF4375)
VDWYDAAAEYWLRVGSLSSLPADWKRELVALMLVNREVANGAYLQFLGNHGREMYVYATRALRNIGAKRMADIIDRCQALVDEHFPTEGKSPDELPPLMSGTVIGLDGVAREEESVLPEAVVERVTALSYEFMEYPEDVADLAESYYRPLIEGDQRA